MYSITIYIYFYGIFRDLVSTSKDPVTGSLFLFQFKAAGSNYWIYSTVTKFGSSNKFVCKIHRSKSVVKPLRIFQTKIVVSLISQYFFDIQNIIEEFSFLLG